jgi:hypothetical protein
LSIGIRSLPLCDRDAAFLGVYLAGVGGAQCVGLKRRDWELCRGLRQRHDAPNASAGIPIVGSQRGSAWRDGRLRGATSTASPATNAVGAHMRRSSTAHRCAIFMVQESACFPGKCTTTVQLTTASITSVFQKQSVVKDHFSSAVKPVNRMYNEGW